MKNLMALALLICVSSIAMAQAPTDGDITLNCRVAGARPVAIKVYELNGQTFIAAEGSDGLSYEVSGLVEVTVVNGPNRGVVSYVDQYNYLQISVSDKYAVDGEVYAADIAGRFRSSDGEKFIEFNKQRFACDRL